MMLDEEDSIRSSTDSDDDSLSSSNNISARNSSSEGTSSATENEKDEIAVKESRAVFGLRLLVIVVLLLASIAVSLVVFFTTSQSEKNQFKTQYEGAANKVIETFVGMTVKMGGISALGVALTAHAIDHNNTWPFVTLSSFQERASTARSQSGAVYIAFTPIVIEDDRKQWENYTQLDPDGWIEEGLGYQINHIAAAGLELKSLPNMKKELHPGPIWTFGWDSNTVDVSVDPGPGPYMPNWQLSPIVREGINLNILNVPFMRDGAAICIGEVEAYIGEMISSFVGGPTHENLLTSFFATVMSFDKNEMVEYQGDPMSYIYIPVFDSFVRTERKVVGVVLAAINWGSLFENILPQNSRGIIVVLENCKKTYTYKINGDSVQRDGEGDLHDPKFQSLEKSFSLTNTTTIPDGTELGIQINHGNCPYRIRVYPSQVFYDAYVTDIPMVITIAVAMIFIFAAAMFFVYDNLVERRQRLVMMRAVKTTAIVASLFPKSIRERLMQDDTYRACNKKIDYVAPKYRLQSFLGGVNEDDSNMSQKPIADLFPHTTVLFADIAGFTAWSSTRDPTNVFVLLQSVYQAFDALAKRRRVFKVETIGDCYVAVTGVPEPQPNHALIMAKFAADCMEKMTGIVRKLELTLGPGTDDLAMRFGMHSGPVTAGVLRGDRSRFQLFGDTVNTAARMESTGAINKIQASQATADIIISSGKGHWVTPRGDAVEAKGKGVLTTFWIMPSTKKGASTNSTTSSSKLREASSEIETIHPQCALKSHEIERRDRLIDWMTELLKDYIKPIKARRKHLGKERSMRPLLPVPSSFDKESALEELTESICLPSFDPNAIAAQTTLAPRVVLSDEFSEQLREYVAIIASMYRSNPFHNFEHAAHVTLSVHKFIQRIATPDDQPAVSNIRNDTFSEHHMASKLHEYTHGITSDPITLFAIIFSALIHDVDHRGVSNAQLMNEEEQMAAYYGNKSVAEQNSLSLSWNLLMSDEFDLIRSEIFGDAEELKRFRQVVVNVVLATDIFDKELNDHRKTRWEKAFSVDEKDDNMDKVNLRATIVIEHIIQASDVSHTMQHWHVYRKWNTLLFREMISAHRSGRMAVDPSTFWYKGELAFFDNYIIPLAKKLEDCKVFGVSSDECLNYAIRNRAEWEERGQQIVAELLQDLEKKAPPEPTNEDF